MQRKKGISPCGDNIGRENITRLFDIIYDQTIVLRLFTSVYLSHGIYFEFYTIITQKQRYDFKIF